MTLKSKFSLAFMGYTALVLALFSVAYIAIERRNAERFQRAEQALAAEKLVSVCRTSSLASSAVIALNYIQALKREASFVFAACVDAQGLVQAHSDSKWIGRKLEDAPSPAQLERVEAGPQVRWNAPVQIGQTRAGLALLAYDRLALRAALNDKLASTLKQLLIVAACTFVLAIAISLILASGLAKPIRKVVEAAKSIGSGRLDTQTQVVGAADELVVLANEMNAMALQLKKLDELKAEFINIVSHDLRSPLGAIIAYSDFLLSGHIGPLQPKQQTSIETIRSQCRLLTNLVNNILDMGRIQAGKMQFLREPFDFGEVMTNVHRLFEFAAKQKKISMSLALEKAPLQAVGDTEKVQQVVSNLVSNAIKFTPEGRSIVVGARRFGAKGQLEAFVQDTGPGIPSEELPRMFARFHQVNPLEQRSQKIRGTGLGLAISKGIVESLGGKIWVESTVGQGSTFLFTLPLANNNGGSHGGTSASG